MWVVEILDYLDLNRTLNYINKRVDEQLELEDILSLIRQKYLPTVFFYDGEVTVMGTSAVYDFCIYNFVGYIYPPSHTYLLQGADTVIKDGYCYEVITSAKLQTNMLNTNHTYKPSLEEQDFIRFNPAYTVDGKNICIPKVAIDTWLNRVSDANQSNSHEDSQTAGLYTDNKTEQLGENQRRLITYELLTAHHIACLLSDHSPVGEVYNNDDYKLYKEMVDIAVDARALNVFNDKGQIASGEVKVWLARRDFIYKGFNDNLVECLDYEDDPLKEVTDELAGIISVVFENNTKKDEEIEQLAADYEELRLEHEELLKQKKYICEDLEKYKHSNNEDFSQHWEAESKKYQAEIIELKQQLKGRMEKPPIDDPSIEVHHKSFKTVDRIMYAMAELTKLDNSNPYSQNARTLNEKITTILQDDGLPLEYEAVGKWLTRINELKSKNK